MSNTLAPRLRGILQGDGRVLTIALAARIAAEQRYLHLAPALAEIHAATIADLEIP